MLREFEICLFIETTADTNKLILSMSRGRCPTGSLLTAACRKLEPGDKMEICEPIHKI